MPAVDVDNLPEQDLRKELKKVGMCTSSLQGLHFARSHMSSACLSNTFRWLPACRHRRSMLSSAGSSWQSTRVAKPLWKRWWGLRLECTPSLVLGGPWDASHSRIRVNIASVACSVVQGNNIIAVPDGIWWLSHGFSMPTIAWLGGAPCMAEGASAQWWCCDGC